MLIVAMQTLLLWVEVQLEELVEAVVISLVAQWELEQPKLSLMQLEY
jgi:hypothetical protein